MIEQWAASGVTQEAFCEARGVSVSSMRWWKWKLGRKDAVQRPRPRPRPVRREPAAAVGPGFVPVRIVERGESLGAVAPHAGFDLTLRGGLRVRVPRDFDQESLARLLAVLEERRSC